MAEKRERPRTGAKGIRKAIPRQEVVKRRHPRQSERSQSPQEGRGSSRGREKGSSQEVKAVKVARYNPVKVNRCCLVREVFDGLANFKSLFDVQVLDKPALLVRRCLDPFGLQFASQGCSDLERAGVFFTA